MVLQALAMLSAVAVAPLRINGLVAATFTPFTANGSVAGDVVAAQADWLQKTGVRWVFVSGTTGESLKLSFTERQEQAQRWVSLGPRYNISVIVHVGTESVVEAMAHARHAEQIGAAGLGWMPPVFFKAANVDALAATLAKVAAAAPSLPFYYYHIPSMTGVTFAMMDLVAAVEKIGVPNFAGVKYTGLYTFPGFMDAGRLVAYKGGKYEVFGGREEMLIEAVAAGVKGFVGSQFNFAGDYYNQLLAVSAAGDKREESRAMQLVADDLIVRFGKAVSAGVDGCKNILNVAGGPAVGDSRTPAVSASAADLAQLRETVRAWCETPDTAANATLLCRTLSSH